MTKQAQGHFRAVTSSPQDLAQLEAIMRETFTDTFANEQSAEDLNAFLDKNYNQLVLKRELTDQDSETFFYKVDGQPAAYLKVNWNAAQTEKQFENALEIQRIYVRQQFQKLHIGGILMRHALEIAQQQNRDRLVFNVSASTRLRWARIAKQIFCWQRSCKSYANTRYLWLNSKAIKMIKIAVSGGFLKSIALKL